MNKEKEKEFFDTLEEGLTKADIAFRAYEKGYADAKEDIREGLEKLTVELSTNEFTSAIMHDFYNSIKINCKGNIKTLNSEKIDRLLSISDDIEYSQILGLNNTVITINK